MIPLHESQARLANQFVVLYLRTTQGQQQPTPSERIRLQLTAGMMLFLNRYR